MEGPWGKGKVKMKHTMGRKRNTQKAELGCWQNAGGAPGMRQRGLAPHALGRSHQGQEHEMALSGGLEEAL